MIKLEKRATLALDVQEQVDLVYFTATFWTNSSEASEHEQLYLIKFMGNTADFTLHYAWIYLPAPIQECRLSFFLEYLSIHIEKVGMMQFLLIYRLI